ncbi:Rieske (2Fe-2S) protein [Burkholderia vietnamiensis]|uniref:Rieske (2Fe-2S) protein n=1 Tax=Burkholderia vietnamiensis TaxID=60552 RepID=UPI00264FD8AB|nr:Rieske 2Fe-2S domain-containing protein [Burkholderia vietnamiensis]MDN8037073.1 Rieske 2Fe-2S domain-containing protein [Burkholderia vietnamiensis]
MLTGLCSAIDFASASARGFDLRGDGKDTIFVVNVQGSLHAYVNACPHYEQSARVPLAWARNKYLNAAGTHIVCTGHGALFDAMTGECISGPCKGASLVRVPIEVSSEGVLTLTTTRLTGDSNDPTR